MVLADLGRKLNAAFSQLNAAPIVDEKVRLLLEDAFLLTVLDIRCSMPCLRRFAPPF